MRSLGKRISIVTTEARPGNEGLRTIEVADALGFEITVGIDAAIGALLRRCTSVIVGADSITSVGAALCKVGSFPTALVAERYGIPFRVVADTSKLDPNTRLGVPLRIREMPAADIITTELPVVTVRNPVFELVPASLIEGVVTERGIIPPGGVAHLMEQLPRSEFVTARVAEQYRQGREDER